LSTSTVNNNSDKLSQLVFGLIKIIFDTLNNELN